MTGEIEFFPVKAVLIGAVPQMLDSAFDLVRHMGKCDLGT